MAKALGQLPSAPLIYVLAQIVFTRIPKVGSLWEDFHQRLFNIYPESEVEHFAQFSLKNEGPEVSKETRWHLLSRDRSKGLIFSANTLILHTTSYTTSKDFFDDLAAALKILIDVIPKAIKVNRLGLRYIDLLLPQHGLEVDQQVVDHLRMVSLDQIHCKPVRFERVANYATPIGGELIFRHIQTTGMDVLPGDLFPNKLKPAPLLATPKPTKSIVGLLDFDHFLQEDMHLETEAVIEKFRDLQKTTSAAFRTVTTSAATQAWQENS